MDFVRLAQVIALLVRPRLELAQLAAHHSH